MKKKSSYIVKKIEKVLICSTKKVNNIDKKGKKENNFFTFCFNIIFV